MIEFAPHLQVVLETRGVERARLQRFEHGRVKRPDGSAITSLYAAGGATGGLEGGGAVGYVGGLIKACVFGLRVAEHAAGQLNREADILK